MVDESLVDYPFGNLRVVHGLRRVPKYSADRFHPSHVLSLLFGNTDDRAAALEGMPLRGNRQAAMARGRHQSFLGGGEGGLSVEGGGVASFVSPVPPLGGTILSGEREALGV